MSISEIRGSLILSVEVPDVESVAGDYRADVLDGSVWSAWVGHPVARAEAEDFHLQQRHVWRTFVPDAGSALLHGNVDDLIVQWQLHGLIVADVELCLEDCSHGSVLHWFPVVAICMYSVILVASVP